MSSPSRKRRASAPRGGMLDFARAMLIIVGALVSGVVVWWLTYINFGGLGNVVVVYSIGVGVFVVCFLLPAAWIEYRYFRGPMSSAARVPGRLPTGMTAVSRQKGPRVEFADDPFSPNDPV